MAGPDLSQYATQESPDLLWMERATYISVNLGLIAYGVHIFSAFMCAYQLIKEKDMKKNWKLLFFVLTLFVFGTMNISVNMMFNQMAWIDYREYPGGPAMFLLHVQAIPVQIREDGITIIAVNLLANALLIYRVHVLYQRWYVIVIPIFTWFAIAILGALYIAQGSRPTSGIWEHMTFSFALLYSPISMALNFLLTGLLVARLLHMRRQLTVSLGSQYDKTYSNIITMLLESAAPSGLLSIAFLVFYAIGNSSTILFVPLIIQVECISPIIIILRVARGRAMTNDKTSQIKISQIRFNKNVHTDIPVHIPSNSIVQHVNNRDSQEKRPGTSKETSIRSHLSSIDLVRESI